MTEVLWEVTPEVRASRLPRYNKLPKATDTVRPSVLTVNSRAPIAPCSHYDITLTSIIPRGLLTEQSNNYGTSVNYHRSSARIIESETFL